LNLLLLFVFPVNSHSLMRHSFLILGGQGRTYKGSLCCWITFLL
jgi:hypothetical protein